MTNTENNNVDKMISGLAGLALVTIGVKNFKHPSWLTGVAVVAGAYMLYKGIKTFLPEKEEVQDYMADAYYSEPEPDYI